MTLLAHLPLNGHPRDLVGTNNGTWTGVESYANESPVGTGLAQSANLAGSEKITLPNEATFDFDRTDPYSISLSMRGTDVSSNLVLVSKKNNLGGNDEGWIVFTLSGTGVVFFKFTNPTNGNTSATGITITDGRWHTIVVTYDGNSNQNGMKVYVDGVLRGTGASSPFTAAMVNNESVIIGDDGAGGNKITAKIKDVKIWDVELTLADVQQLNKVAFNRWGVGVSDGDDLP